MTISTSGYRHMWKQRQDDFQYRFEYFNILALKDDKIHVV